jgi:dethiobiotin synthetase
VRGLFVTGTDTGVGKTVLTGAITAALASQARPVRALKPVITGLEDPRNEDWPPDHELLARAAGCAPQQVAVFTYGPAVSPHLAAQLAGRPIAPDELRERILSSVTAEEILIVEGVGGLLVPLSDGYDVRQLAVDLALPLLIAARPGLGTINHTLMTLACARAAGLKVAGVVLTPWPEMPTEIERSNRETIERLGEVAVSTLPLVARGEPELLRAAGQELPLSAWLELNVR